MKYRTNHNPKRIKLVFAPEFWSAYPSPLLPYGMGLFSGVLRSHSYYVDDDDLWIKALMWKNDWVTDPAILLDDKAVYDYFFGKKFQKVFENLTDEMMILTQWSGYDVIGFTVVGYPQFIASLLLARHVKKRYQTTIIFGGPFITIHGESFFKDTEYVDYMIKGEGENSFLDFLSFVEKRKTIESVPGLMYRHEAGVRINPVADYNIHTMPLPDFSGLNLPFYHSKWPESKGALLLPYKISKGCRYGCYFCASSGYENFAFKDHDQVLADLHKYSTMYKSNYFWFVDFSIDFSYDYLNGLCDRLIALNSPYKWKAWARIDVVDQKLLTKMNRAGCLSLFYGVESGSDRMLQLMGKRFTSQKAAEVLALTRMCGIHAHIGLMTGYPHENWDDVRHTTMFLEKNAAHISSASVNKFILEKLSPHHTDPGLAQIQNIKRIPSAEHRLAYSFDEIGGLPWQKKRKQQERFFSEVEKSIAAMHQTQERTRTRSLYSVHLKKKGYAFLSKMSQAIHTRHAKKFYFLGGMNNGVYDDLGKRISMYLKRHYGYSLECSAGSTSVRNLRLLKEKQKQVACIQASVYFSNQNGRNKISRYNPVLAMPLKEYFTCVVSRKSGICSFSDLAGRSISINHAESGVHCDIKKLLLGQTVQMNEPATLYEFNTRDSLDKCIRGEIDGFFLMSHHPSPVLFEYITSNTLSFIPIPHSLIKDPAHSYLSKGYIDMSFYGKAGLIETLFSDMLMVVSRDFPKRIRKHFIEAICYEQS
jgi:TRAP transporter TAXI family solute receptor